MARILSLALCVVLCGLVATASGQLSDKAKARLKAANKAKANAKANAKKNEAEVKTNEKKLADLKAQNEQIARLVAQAKEKLELWEAAQNAKPADERAFSLKGDRLGMTLGMFKGKYFRDMPDDNKNAPMTSEQHVDFDNPGMFYTADMGKVGIINARTTFPYEESDNRTDAFHPTIAGAKAELFIYHFVDQQLYQMTIWLDHSDFNQVIEAMKEKFGEPQAEKAETYNNAFGAKFDGTVSRWENSVSSIFAVERAGKVDQSLIVFSHKELKKLADERIKKPRAKDL